MRGQFSNAVDRPAVQACGAMRLGLKSDADVFDGTGDDGVGDAGESAGGEILTI